MDMASIVRRVERSFDPEFYRREAARNAQIAELLEGIPTTDKFEVGQVITFEKVYPSTKDVYQFAARKFDEAYWAVTGSCQSGSVYTWTTLLDFIGFDNLDTVGVVTDVQSIKTWYKKQTEIKEIQPVEEMKG